MRRWADILRTAPLAVRQQLGMFERSKIQCQVALPILLGLGFAVLAFVPEWTVWMLPAVIACGLVALFFALNGSRNVDSAEALGKDSIASSFFENASDVIVVLTAEANILKVNRACESLWHYKPEQLVGQPIVRFVLEASAKMTMDKLRHSTAHGATTFETRMRCGDGSIKEMLWSVRWSKDAWFCIVRDVSRDRQIAKLKNDFINMISHDLRAPLTSIQAILTMLREHVYGEIPERAEQEATRAEQDCRRLIDMITQLLDIEKMESGKFKMRIETVALADLIEDGITALSGNIQFKQITVEKEIGVTRVKADRARVTQVIINLLSNALKFAPAKSTITITTTEAGESARVSIIDRGRGIPSEVLDRIFDRYAQVEEADQRIGSGLGLAICKAIVEQNGGTIGVESEHGNGSTFWFTLPIATTAIPAEAAR